MHALKRDSSRAIYHNQPGCSSVETYFCAVVGPARARVCAFVHAPGGACGQVRARPAARECQFLHLCLRAVPMSTCTSMILLVSALHSSCGCSVWAQVRSVDLLRDYHPGIYISATQPKLAAQALCATEQPITYAAKVQAGDVPKP